MISKLWVYSSVAHLMTLATRDIENALCSKGFNLEASGDHRRFNYPGTAITTKISHGAIEIDDFYIGLMAEQTRLTKERFIDLVKCPYTGEAYKSDLVSGKILPPQIKPR